MEVYNGLASTIEYNRWLVTEENWKVAEDTRETLGQIRDFRRAVREDRLSKGRQRANESRSQRGEAQRKVQEHHMQNAAGGSEVKSLVDNWNDQLSTQRRAWSDYGNSLKTVLKPDLKKVKADNQEEKAKLAKQVRDEIELVESLREQALQKLEETNRQNASRVKTETGPATTDAARRLFYSQRKKLADETVKQEEEWRAGVAENKQIHMQKAVEHAEAAKATRTQARDARSALEEQRHNDAKELRKKRIEMREQKAIQNATFLKSTREKHNTLMGSKFVSPEMMERMQSHSQYKLLTTVVAEGRSPVRSAAPDEAADFSADEER
uniref:Uncharacterized protein n=1 Tax=Haptolina ericina TaxID=156174 RepID=A0A7S3C6Z0_9EUKA